MDAFRHVFEDGEDAMRAPRKLRDVTADLPFSRRGDALRCRHNSHASQLGNHDSHRKDLNLVTSLLKLVNTCNCRKVQSALEQSLVHWKAWGAVRFYGPLHPQDAIVRFYSVGQYLGMTAEEEGEIDT